MYLLFQKYVPLYHFFFMFVLSSKEHVLQPGKIECSKKSDSNKDDVE